MLERERERERGGGERERVMNASVVSLPKWLFPQEKEPTDEEVYKRLVCTFLRKSCKLSCSRLCSRLYVLRRKDVEKTILIDNFFPPTGRKKEREREREREKSEKRSGAGARSGRGRGKSKREEDRRRRKTFLRFPSQDPFSLKLLPIEENLSR